MREYLVEVISEGIAIGDAKVIKNDIIDSDGKKINIEEEISKLIRAIQKSIVQLEELKELEVFSGEDFIEVHTLLLKDEYLKKEIIFEIRKGISAKRAFIKTMDHYIDNVKQSSSTYLKERYLDFEDIKNRVSRNMDNISYQSINNQEIILVVDELIPSLLMEFKKNVKGVIAKKGGYTSHGAILCKAREIPYVVLPNFEISNDETVIIDTRKKLVVVEPSEASIIDYEYLEMSKEIEKPNYNYSALGIQVLANVSDNAELKKVVSYNFDGVGLYRTEFIFMNSERPLSFDEQYEIYHEAVLKLKGKPICFRTFDVGDDKQLFYAKCCHKGILNYKNNPSLFENQVKAILKANDYGNVRIMFPMIEEYEEFVYLRDWVLKLKEEMHDTRTIKIGMMLETKKALMDLNDFKDVDFFSLGTNDLTLELYHTLRDEILNYRSFITDLVEKLKIVVKFCEENNISLSICGELASVRNVAKRLLKIGVKNFSVSASSLLTLEHAIREHFSKEY